MRKSNESKIDYRQILIDAMREKQSHCTASCSRCSKASRIRIEITDRDHIIYHKNKIRKVVTCQFQCSKTEEILETPQSPCPYGNNEYPCTCSTCAHGTAEQKKVLRSQYPKLLRGEYELSIYHTLYLCALDKEPGIYYRSFYGCEHYVPKDPDSF